MTTGEIYESPEISNTDDSFFPYLAAVLTNLIALNNSEKEQITLFHSVEPPDSPICEYMHRIRKFFDCSNECFVLSFVYIDRILKLHTDFCISVLNIHRLLLTSVMLAAKFFDDTYYSNAVYARIGGVPTEEMNSLEYHFLILINYRLFVPVQEYDQYRRDVLIAATAPIPRSLTLSKMVGSSHHVESYSKLSSSPKYYRVNVITTFVPRTLEANNSNNAQLKTSTSESDNSGTFVSSNPAPACEIPIHRQQPYIVRPYYLNQSTTPLPTEHSSITENPVFNQVPLKSPSETTKQRRRSLHTQNKPSVCRICSVCRQRISPNDPEQRSLYSQQSSQFLPTAADAAKQKINKSLAQCSKNSSVNNTHVFVQKNNKIVSHPKNLTPKLTVSPPIRRSSVAHITPTKPCGYGSNLFIQTFQSSQDQQQQKRHMKTQGCFEKKHLKKSQQQIDVTETFFDVKKKTQQRTYLKTPKDHTVTFYNTTKKCSAKHGEQAVDSDYEISKLHHSLVPLASYEQYLRPMTQKSQSNLSNVDTFEYPCNMNQKMLSSSTRVNSNENSKYETTSGGSVHHSFQDIDLMRYKTALKYNKNNFYSLSGNSAHLFTPVGNSSSVSGNLMLPSTANNHASSLDSANSMYTLLFPSSEKSTGFSCSGGAMMLTNDSLFNKTSQTYGIPFSAVYY